MVIACRRGGDGRRRAKCEFSSPKDDCGEFEGKISKGRALMRGKLDSPLSSTPSPPPLICKRNHFSHGLIRVSHGNPYLGLFSIARLPRGVAVDPRGLSYPLNGRWHTLGNLVCPLIRCGAAPVRAGSPAARAEAAVPEIHYHLHTMTIRGHLGIYGMSHH